MVTTVDGYSPAELQQLQGSAEHLLGWQVIFNQLHIPANGAKGIRDRIVDSRGKVAIAISELDFFPTQDEKWQKMIDRDADTRGPRDALQIFSGFATGNPLVSVTLQQGPKATTTPLAVIKRVMAATGGNKAEEFTWKKLLTEKMGIPSSQLLALMQEMNFTNIRGTASPVQLRSMKLRGESEELDAPESAHEDLLSKLKLDGTSKNRLAELLIAKLAQEKAEQQ